MISMRHCSFMDTRSVDWRYGQLHKLLNFTCLINSMTLFKWPRMAILMSEAGLTRNWYTINLDGKPWDLSVVVWYRARIEIVLVLNIQSLKQWQEWILIQTLMNFKHGIKHLQNSLCRQFSNLNTNSVRSSINILKSWIEPSVRGRVTTITKIELQNKLGKVKSKLQWSSIAVIWRPL